MLSSPLLVFSVQCVYSCVQAQKNLSSDWAGHSLVDVLKACCRIHGRERSVGETASFLCALLILYDATRVLFLLAQVDTELRGTVAGAFFEAVETDKKKVSTGETSGVTIVKKKNAVRGHN